MARKLELVPHDHSFQWPDCDICHAPMDFHSIQDEPVWYCSDCGTCS